MRHVSISSMVLELGIGVPLFHGCTAASNKLTPLIDDSRAIDERQMPLGLAPRRLSGNPPPRWRKVRQPISQILLDFESVGGTLRADLGVLGRGVQSSAIVLKS